jgi:hypothetical protein
VVASTPEAGAPSSGNQNSRPDGPNDTEDLKDLINPGSREFWVDERLDGGAAPEGLRELREARD